MQSSPLNAGLVALGAMALLAPQAPASAQSQPGAQTLSPAELFDFADKAIAAGDHAAAETAYRALAGNPDRNVRSEARFRLGMMLADLKRYADAAVQFRLILDEQPNAARVRIELARMDAMLGDLAAARRELRAAEATPLPPEVRQLVRFFSNVLTANKPLGGSIELAFAPDTNINRATRSETLGTAIGDFALSEDARERSGLGIAGRGQVYGRLRLDGGTRLLASVSASGNIYRDSAFDDLALGAQIGPEFQLGSDRLSFSGGPAWRWFGQRPYSLSYGASGTWLHAVGKRGQLRIDLGARRTEIKPNDLQSGDSFTASVGIDRAFSARFGGGVQLYAGRDTARDPAYADANGGFSGYAFREFGRTTAVVSASYRHLEADARVFLYPERRRDDYLALSASGTFRSLRLGRFAPFARVRAERNISSLEIYDYRRLSAEFGLTSAF